jgi:RimJ/RimL family protein N-acetyltransferase
MPIQLESIQLRHATEVERFAADPAVGAVGRAGVASMEGRAIEWVKSSIGARRRGQAYDFAMIERDHGFVGCCGLKLAPGGGEAAELGFWIARPYWGRGYATAGCAQLIRIAFTNLALTRLYARCRESNLASQRVLEKLGFRLERAQGRANGPSAERVRHFSRFAEEQPPCDPF